jgi:hypothetical protein
MLAKALKDNQTLLDRYISLTQRTLAIRQFKIQGVQEEVLVRGETVLQW